MSKKVTFLGIEFDVIDEEEQRNAPPGTVYGIVRVADASSDGGSPALKARRLKIPCDQCKEVCWFDPLSFGVLPKSTPRLCLQCLQQRIELEAE